MDREDTLTQITQENIDFVESELEKNPRPFSLHEISEKLAFQKTAGQRVQDVLKYDPLCRYEVGDLIFKEYNESLPVSSKTVEEFSGAVVLKVINKNFYKEYNCEMLEVDYTGGGLFRKFIDYMKKTKTQVLLPANVEGKALSPEKMEKAEDPRLTELPMTDRDLRTLQKKLQSALTHSDKFFKWNDQWQLTKNQAEVPEEKVKEIEAFIKENRQSVPAEELVKKFFGLEPSHNHFDLTCLSMNYVLEKKYKKEFLFVWPLGWGKWHLKSIFNSLLKDLPLSAPAARLPELEGTEKPQLSTFHDFPLKIYLTWREVLSGGVKVPKSLNKELSASREYIFFETEEGKNYPVYYYPSSHFFLGLKDYFSQHNIPQGTSLTLERKGPCQFSFWVKKSKKKLSVVKLTYDSKEDKLQSTGEEVFTFALPNKIIYLEKETLDELLSFSAQRDDHDLRDLLILIFKNFGLEGTDRSLHFLRAYHLVDVLKQTTQEDIETTLLNSPEFILSAKKKGIFLYQEPEKVRAEPEVAPEIIEMPTVEGAPEAPLEEITPSLESEAEEMERQPLPPVIPLDTKERIRPSAVPPAKKEKPPKKRKIKMEGERAPRVRKSERKVIEERIELEESEQEALAALKEKEAETEKKELVAKEKKAEPKRAISQETGFGLFAEKLKSALDKKKKEEPKK